MSKDKQKIEALVKSLRRMQTNYLLYMRDICEESPEFAQLLFKISREEVQRLIDMPYEVLLQVHDIPVPVLSYLPSSTFLVVNSKKDRSGAINELLDTLESDSKGKTMLYSVEQMMP